MIKKILTLGALLAVPMTLNAALIDKGIFNADTITGLDWLDLSQTANLSYQQVAEGLTVGGDFEGWRFANESDVDTLNTHLGFSSYFVVLDEVTAPADDAALLTFVDLFDVELGSTLNYAMYEGELSGGLYSNALEYVPLRTGGYFSSLNNDIGMGVDAVSPHTSSLLVRESVSDVPVPAAIWLFGSALLGLGAAKRQAKA